MKLENEQDKDQVELVFGDNPICDVLSSADRGSLILSDRDMEVLRQIAKTTPAPTKQLVQALQKAMENKVTKE